MFKKLIFYLFSRIKKYEYFVFNNSNSIYLIIFISRILIYNLTLGLAKLYFKSMKKVKISNSRIK